MDTTIIITLGVAVGATIATALTITTLVLQSIESLRNRMDQRIDALIYSNQRAHDNGVLRLDAQREEQRKRLDAQGNELRGSIDALRRDVRTAIAGHRHPVQPDRRPG